MVVAHQRQRAAIFGRTGKIGVAEDVAGTVDARPLAVPERKHPVVFAFAQKLASVANPSRP